MNNIERMISTLDAMLSSHAPIMQVNRHEVRIADALREKVTRGPRRGEFVHDAPDWSLFPVAREWFIQHDGFSVRERA